MPVYFAYGSNLLFARLHARCPSVVNIGTGELLCHRLTFNKPGGDESGKCGIEPAESNESVIGVLYQMVAEEKPVLDEIEGVGHGYVDKQVNVKTIDGQVDCFTYYPTRLDSALPPWDWYKAFVVEGARQNGFPASYIAKLNSVEALTDPNAQRREENLLVIASGPGINNTNR